MNTIRINLIQLRRLKSFNGSGWNVMRSAHFKRLVRTTLLVKPSQTARDELATTYQALLRVFLRLPMRGKLRNMGCPDNRKVGGYGVFILIKRNLRRLICVKGNRFMRTETSLNTADLKMVGFEFSNEDKITNILKRVASINNLIVAYDKIKLNLGNITPRVIRETLVEMRKVKLGDLSADLNRGRFRFKPARPVMTPKRFGGERPLPISSSSDKIVHQAIKQQLELVFEPLFMERSHGFRPNRGCHTAFNQVKIKFGGVR